MNHACDSSASSVGVCIQQLSSAESRVFRSIFFVIQVQLHFAHFPLYRTAIPYRNDSKYACT